MSVNIFNEGVYSSVSFLFSLADTLFCKATEEKAENARLSSVGELALGDLVKSTFGLKGMNKFCNRCHLATST